MDVATAWYVLRAPARARLFVLYGRAAMSSAGSSRRQAPLVLLIKRAKLAAVEREGDHYVAVKKLREK